eukprot:6182331-Pleurochrysis_carterae.AAC.1
METHAHARTHARTHTLLLRPDQAHLVSHDHDTSIPKLGLLLGRARREIEAKRRRQVGELGVLGHAPRRHASNVEQLRQRAQNASEAHGSRTEHTSASALRRTTRHKQTLAYENVMYI